MKSHITDFLRQRQKLLNLSAIEKEANLPTSVLGKIIRGERVLTPKHAELLLPVLQQEYGFPTEKKACRIISFMNHKGGVGKTTTTVHLGRAMAIEGYKVLIIDFDPQANATDHLGVNHETENIAHALLDHQPLSIISIKEDFDLVPGDIDLAQVPRKYAGSATQFIRLKIALDPIKDQYDFILIDCPPSLEYFTQNALNASTEAVIVSTPTRLSMKGIPLAIDTIEELKMINPSLELLGVVITDSERLKVSKRSEDALRDSKLPIFKTVIRHFKHYKEASEQGLTIFEAFPNHHSTQDYQKLAKEIING
ncbi:ParA family protein [Persicobacter psychrovividus]|uniref:Sporulation initiation inhibitor Soj n=1 Tax=Persicobacter psychrovividus TaxID=387638 RepID=A0ABN6LHR4_9BACT|nr:sporulation initiation inhibitor Soj [Persicobacter psychrovividus]